MNAMERLQLESTLRARSQVARFGILTEEMPTAVQLALPGAPFARHDAKEMPTDCDHAETGREPQARLFGGGFDTVCSRCGATTVAGDSAGA
jgi:hypothetical protein